MPNHVTHAFTIEGDEKEIKRFLDKCFIKEDGNTEFDFNALIPMPEILNKTISGNTSEMETVTYKKTEKEAINQSGHKNWYDWRIENWGTKWNAYHTRFDDHEDLVELEFDTAWSCPEPIFYALGKQFPKLYFKGYALDECFNFGASVEIEEGEVAVRYFDVDPDFYISFGYRMN